MTCSPYFDANFYFTELGDFTGKRVHLHEGHSFIAVKDFQTEKAVSAALVAQLYEEDIVPQTIPKWLVSCGDYLKLPFGGGLWPELSELDKSPFEIDWPRLNQDTNTAVQDLLETKLQGESKFSALEGPISISLNISPDERVTVHDANTGIELSLFFQAMGEQIILNLATTHAARKQLPQSLPYVLYFTIDLLEERLFEQALKFIQGMTKQLIIVGEENHFSRIKRTSQQRS